LAKKVVESNEPKGVVSFAAMDIEVARNAFGRQIDSFEVPIQFASFVSPLNAVFIRGPLIKSSWGNSKVLAYLDEKIVAVRQKEFLALSFHPEITRDLRIHEYFLEMVSEQRARVQ
jgi:5'-phosphate synthase pdxT subunit